MAEDACRAMELPPRASPVQPTLAALGFSSPLPSAIYCIEIDMRDDGTLTACPDDEPTVSGTRRIGDFFTTADEIAHQTGLNFFAGPPDDVETASNRSCQTLAGLRADAQSEQV